MSQEEKDFLISYHEADRKWAEWIAYTLEAEGHPCIIRAWDFRPGSNSVWETHKALSQVKRTLIILSPEYLKDSGSHQAEWMTVFSLDPTGEKGVLIPIRIGECTPSGLLASRIYIDLVGLPESIARPTLLTGVARTRLKPSHAPIFPANTPDFPGPINVLIASLGDSPAIVTAMYDCLTEKEPPQIIDRVNILCPEDDDVERSYKLIKKSFPDERKLYHKTLPFKDVDSKFDACKFLQSLCDMLDRHQEKGDRVYLSLAGGRKSMAALMAWVVPYYSCVQGLYHLVSTEKDYFPSVYEIEDMSEEKRALEMHPDLNHLSLVSIPFTGEQLMSEKLRTKLYGSSPDEYKEAETLFQNKQDEEIEALITAQTIFQKATPLEVVVTQRVIDQFTTLCQKDAETAQAVHNRLLEMSQIATLRGHDFESHSLKVPHFRRVTLHFSTLSPLAMHLVFYTGPVDISSEADTSIERVVICSLETEGEHGYKTLKELAPELAPTIKQTFSIDKLTPPPSPVESVLIVPLGEAPMVATQLYTLLTEVERHTIREVVLIYPQDASTVHNGARMIRNALQVKDKSVRCKLAGIPGLADITSSEDCITYQNALETEIGRVKDEYRDSNEGRGIKIDLALSGGRKGMTAMTIFAAQKHHIPYVYHTLITNEEVRETIDDETTYEKLNATSLSQQERLDRLFLQKYKGGGPCPYNNFTLFRVPVFTGDGW